MKQKSCQLFYSKNRANFFVPRETKISEKMLDFLKFLARGRQ